MDDTSFVRSPRSQAPSPRQGKPGHQPHVIPDAGQFHSPPCCPVSPRPQGHNQLTLWGITGFSSWSQTLWPKGASTDWTQRSLPAHLMASPFPPPQTRACVLGPPGSLCRCSLPAAPGGNGTVGGQEPGHLSILGTGSTLRLTTELDKALTDQVSERTNSSSHSIS